MATAEYTEKKGLWVRVGRIAGTPPLFVRLVSWFSFLHL